MELETLAIAALWPQLGGDGLARLEVAADGTIPAAPGRLFDLVLLRFSGAESREALGDRVTAALALLRPGGTLALAGSNRLGLGHLAGQPEPQGSCFAGLAGGEEGGPGRSRHEWRQELAALGFEIRAEYLLAPDVLTPGCCLRGELLAADPELAVDLLCHRPFAHGSLPNFPLAPPLLLAESLARAGLLADFAPAYLWLGGPGGAELPKAGNGLAWHLALDRAPATVTRFERRGGEIWVEKSSFGPAPQLPLLRWQAAPAQPALRGERWRRRLIREAYFATGRFEDELAGLLAELRGRFALAEGDRLQGPALDAIVHNAIRGEAGETSVFDLEWELTEPMPASWWVLRNVLALASSLDTIGHGLGVPHLGELYVRLCHRLALTPSPAEDLRREAELQALLGGGEAATIAAALAALLEKRLDTSPFPPRRPERLGPWQQAMERRSLEVAQLSAAFGAMTQMATDLHWLAEKAADQHRSLESIDGSLRWLAGKLVDPK